MAIYIIMQILIIDLHISNAVWEVLEGTLNSLPSSEENVGPLMLAMQRHNAIPACFSALLARRLASCMLARDLELYTTPERLYRRTRGRPYSCKLPGQWPKDFWKVGPQEKRPAPRLRRSQLYALTMTRKLLCCLLLEEARLVKARWLPRVSKNARACMNELYALIVYRSAPTSVDCEHLWPPHG